MSAAAALLQGALATMPAGANPWTYLGLVLQNRVAKVSPDSFRDQLYVLSGIIAGAILVLFASLVMRFRRHTLWFIRAMPSSRGTLYIPHYLSTWTAFMLIFLACLEANIYETVANSKGDFVRSLILWKTVIWVIAYLGFFALALSLAMTRVLHLDASGYRLTSVFSHPILLNALGVVVPIAVVGSILALSFMTNAKYQHVMDTFIDLQTALGQAAATYNGTMDPRILVQGAGKAEELFHHIDAFSNWFRATFFAYFGWLCFLLFFFAVTAWLHLRQLSWSMQEIARQEQVTADGRSQMKAMQAIYKSLVRISWAMVIVLGTFGAVFGFVAGGGHKTIDGGTYSLVASLLGPYIFAVLGLPLSLLLLLRARENTKEAAPAEEDRGPSRTDGASFIDLSQQTAKLVKAQNYSGGKLGNGGVFMSPEEEAYQMHTMSSQQGSPQYGHALPQQSHSPFTNFHGIVPVHPYQAPTTTMSPAPTYAPSTHGVNPPSRAGSRGPLIAEGGRWSDGTVESRQGLVSNPASLYYATHAN